MLPAELHQSQSEALRNLQCAKGHVIGSEDSNKSELDAMVTDVSVGSTPMIIDVGAPDLVVNVAD